jgi:hypothetical protein
MRSFEKLQGEKNLECSPLGEPYFSRRDSPCGCPY